MRAFELVIAALCTAGGIRSVIYHARRPFDSRDVRDQLLYAMYVTGRVGTWFAVAGMFVILALVGASDPEPDPVTGKFVDIQDASDYAWYVLVFIVLGAMQLLGAWFLGHRGRSSEDGGGPTRRP